MLAGVVLFGLSLVALYSASSIYHYALGAAAKVRRLRKLDHAMIYVLIAGSYTPLCIKFMDPAKLPVFLGAMWTMAAAGILLKLLWLDAPRWLGTLLYLALGWAIVVDLPGPCGRRRRVLLAGGGALHAQVAQPERAVGLPRIVPSVHSGGQRLPLCRGVLLRGVKRACGHGARVIEWPKRRLFCEVMCDGTHPSRPRLRGILPAGH